MSRALRSPVRRRLSAAWACLFLLAGCAATTQPAATQPALDRDFASIVTTLASPAMEGRGPGTAGIERARVFVESQFAAAGLVPGVRPAGGPAGFDQKFELKLGVKIIQQSLTAAAGGHTAAGEPARDFGVLGFAAGGDLAGRPVFVGYGITDAARKYDSYAGGDGQSLAGKVVIAFRYEPMNGPGQSRWSADGSWTSDAGLLGKAEAAERHGAAGFLLVNPPGCDPPGLLSARATGYGPPLSIPAFQISSLFFRQMLKLAGRDPEATLRLFQERADAGTDKPEPLDLTLTGGAKLERKPAEVANVVGLLPGQGTLADQYLVIGAHYDHLGYGDVGSLYRPGPNDPPEAIHPGADDNASGVAGIILVARRLSALVRDGGAPADRRSVLFVAFAGEERGLLGSAHMLNHMDQLGLKTAQVSEMINLDMVGRMRDGTAYVTGEESGDRWDSLVRQAGEGSGLSVRKDTLIMGGSDQMSFWAHKIPAVHFFTGLHADYHRPTDTADKINADGGVRIAGVVVNLAELLWSDPQPVAFRGGGGDVFGRSGVAGRGARLGIVPDPASMEGVAGCAVASVVPGSPAAAAGLAPGDVITALDAAKIANLRDLLAALQAARPGQSVKLTVLRGRETISLVVTLGS